MIILGIVLLVLGAVFNIGILWVLGVILVILGVIFWILGAMGRAVGGRRRYYSRRKRVVSEYPPGTRSSNPVGCGVGGGAIPLVQLA